MPFWLANGGHVTEPGCNHYNEPLLQLHPLCIQALTTNCMPQGNSLHTDGTYAEA